MTYLKVLIFVGTINIYIRVVCKNKWLQNVNFFDPLKLIHAKVCAFKV